MHSYRRLLMFGLFLLCLGWLRGQDPESLLIGPGDTLHIQVFDTPELEQSGKVNDAGYLSLIIGGQVKVVSLTPTEAALAIEKVLVDQELLHHPKVLVTVQAYATQEVVVSGEVKNPGAYMIQTPLSVVDVLTRAGGLNTAADRKVVIQRHGTSEKISYFLSNDPIQALDTSRKVYPGDTVLVPRAGIVYALGSIKIPGGFTMTNNDSELTVLELVARAGGVDATGLANHTRLLRKSKDGYVEIPIELGKMEKGERPDMVLKPDDIVYIPYSYLKLFAANSTSVATSVGTATIYRF